MPAVRKRYTVDEIVEALLIKIDVDFDKLANAPRFQYMLAEAEGGTPAVLEAMRYSEEQAVVAFLRQYDAGTDQDRELVPWEAWAIKAKLDIPKLLGSIVFAMRQQSVNMVKVLAISAHPEIVKAQIKEAKKPEGFKDRREMNVSMGFAPQTKGATFIGKWIAGNEHDDPEPPKEIQMPGEVNVEEVFPDIGLTQKLLTGD